MSQKDHKDPSKSSSYKSKRVPMNFSSSYWKSQVKTSTHAQPSNARFSKFELSRADQAKLLSRGYEVGEAFAAGADGQVHYGTLNSSIDCAVKWCFGELTLHQPSILKFIKHPNMVRLFDFYVTEQKALLIFMEYMDGGDLNTYLMEKVGFWLSENRARHYYLQFGDAFRFLHHLGIAHLDIKCGNILLDRSQLNCKITDYGVSKPVYNPFTGQDADEMQYYFKMDVYKAGEVLYQMLNYQLFDDDEQGGVVVFYNPSLSEEAKRVIEVHLEPDQEARPSFEQILANEPWFEMHLEVNGNGV